MHLHSDSVQHYTLLPISVLNPLEKGDFFFSIDFKLAPSYLQVKTDKFRDIM